MNEVSKLQRNCPACKKVMTYSNVAKKNMAERSKSTCRSCANKRSGKCKERSKKISKAKSDWWKEVKKDEVRYKKQCEHNAKATDALWNDPQRKQEFLEKRNSKEFIKACRDSAKAQWENYSSIEKQKIIDKMVQTRFDNGTLGVNTSKRGKSLGLTFQSKTEKRFIESFSNALLLSNAQPICENGIRYAPDFWSEKLECFIEVKSSWTFDVLTGRKKYYNSKHKCGSSEQLDRIKKLCSLGYDILVAVESRAGLFRIIDAGDITESCNIIEEGKLLSFSFESDIN